MASSASENFGRTSGRGDGVLAPLVGTARPFSTSNLFIASICRRSSESELGLRGDLDDVLELPALLARPIPEITATSPVPALRLITSIRG